MPTGSLSQKWVLQVLQMTENAGPDRFTFAGTPLDSRRCGSRRSRSPHSEDGLVKQGRRFVADGICTRHLAIRGCKELQEAVVKFLGSPHRRVAILPLPDPVLHPVPVKFFSVVASPGNGFRFRRTSASSPQSSTSRNRRCGSDWTRSSRSSLSPPSRELSGFQDGCRRDAGQTVSTSRSRTSPIAPFAFTEFSASTAR